MGLLHIELRQAREKAGLSQKALAERAGIPRNQVVRAERGENITVDTLRKLVAHLPVTELSLLDTKEFRVDIIPEPEKLFMAAIDNVMQLANALAGAIQLALETRTAVEISRRASPPLPGTHEQTADVDPILILHGLERIAGEISEVLAIAN